MKKAGHQRLAISGQDDLRTTLGAGDPAPRSRKVVKVRYLLDGRRGEITAWEGGVEGRLAEDLLIEGGATKSLLVTPRRADGPLVESRRRRGRDVDLSRVNRGDAAAATRIYLGRIAATPRPRRGSISGDSRRRRDVGHSVETGARLRSSCAPSTATRAASSRAGARSTSPTRSKRGCTSAEGATAVSDEARTSRACSASRARAAPSR